MALLVSATVPPILLLKGGGGGGGIFGRSSRGRSDGGMARRVVDMEGEVSASDSLPVTGSTCRRFIRGTRQPIRILIWSTSNKSFDAA